jgi:hypothetical protein
MKLAELEPTFLKRTGATHWQCEDVARDQADGIMFLCPKCFVAKGGPMGTHSIICWQPNVPQDTSPTGGRWTMEGTGFADLTLVAASSSILLTGGCNAHFFIRNGEIVGA